MQNCGNGVCAVAHYNGKRLCFFQENSISERCFCKGVKEPSGSKYSFVSSIVKNKIDGKHWR